MIGWARTRLSSSDAIRLVAVAALYVVAAKLGIELSVAHGVITPVWAPTGIALAALVLFGPRLWPAVALGAFIANATSGASIAEAAGISVGNTLEAVLGAVLLRRVGFRPALDRVRDVLALIVLAAIAGTAVSATNGVTTLWISGDVPSGSYGSDWLLWWIGDAMGALIVAPLLLVWSTAPWRELSGARRLEALLLVLVLAGLSAIVFLGGFWRYPHLLFPLLVWATLRFRQPGAVTGNFLIAAIAVAGAVGGTTPISGRSPTEVVQILEGLLAAVAVAMLILGAVLAERAAAEEKLEHARATLAEAQKVARIGSWEWNMPANQVTWSDELYRLYGLAPQSIEMTVSSFLDRVHPADRKAIKRTVADACEDGRPFAFDHRTVLSNGDVRWLHGRGRVIVDGTGTPTRMVGTSQEITEQRRLDELRDNILSAVSHELRTPLTSILGFAVTLKHRGSLLGEQRRSEIVAALAREAAKLDRLLSDLLDIDRLRRGFIRPNFRPTEVGPLVERVVADYVADGRSIEVRADSVVANVDAPKVERIVANLLENAIRHTPLGTDIRVRVERSDGGVLLAVDDRGPGVPPEERESIFGIFNRGDAAAEHSPGAGVGLSLVAQFAELHNGRAWVEDNPGGGACFCVLLSDDPHG